LLRSLVPPRDRGRHELSRTYPLGHRWERRSPPHYARLPGFPCPSAAERAWCRRQGLAAALRGVEALRVATAVRGAPAVRGVAALGGAVRPFGLVAARRVC